MNAAWYISNESIQKDLKIETMNEISEKTIDETCEKMKSKSNN